MSKRLENYKAKLKVAIAEETIRTREYNTAMRALKKVVNEVVDLERRIEYEIVKHERATESTK